MASIKSWAWAFAAGVLLTVAMIAVWKVGAVTGGFVLTMVSTVLTLIIALVGVVAMISEAHAAREPVSASESHTPSPARLSSLPRQKPLGRIGARPDAVGPKFHVETQGGTAYVAESMTFAPESHGGRSLRIASDGGTSRAE
jgi:hypothetical protein